MVFNKTIKTHIAGVYAVAQCLASVAAMLLISFTMPLTIKSKLEQKGAAAGLPSAAEETDLSSVSSNVFVFTTLITICYMFMITNRHTDSCLTGAVIGLLFGAGVASSAHALGGVFNPIRIIGGFMSATIDIRTIPILLCPFFGAVTGQSIYKYVLTEDDLGAIFAEDEEEV